MNMTFSQPVILEGVISSGATSNSGPHYVSDFTILYSKTVNGPLQLYSAQVSRKILIRCHLNFLCCVHCIEFYCNVSKTSVYIC